ncbi:S41 family peptidase [Algoriphagus machipongonensis]|uniref:Peptidase, S41 family n=1 Tax=Algoriphagus machipongonensis TaxID=388413 RepID=A3I041_9BACT|nr:S41 family peptidase [Algoriphagus machipongonensis]EAZ79837.1 peptidase, S41 family [Algoriphagus machipongonensis]
MKYLFFLAFLFASFSIDAQKISKVQLEADLTKLRKGIETYNPALSIYNPNFQKQADSIFSEVTGDSISLIKSFQLISRLCAISNEGHFSLGSWSDPVHSGFGKNEYSYLPLSVKVIDGKLFVWLDYSDEKALKRGEEIVSINGLTASQILSKLYAYTPSDGEITSYVDRNIEMGFSWMYYFYVDQPKVFQLELVDLTGRKREVNINSMIREKQFENLANYYPERAQEEPGTTHFYTLSFENDIAYLTLPSFDYRVLQQDDIKPNQTYKKIFEELKEKNVSSLVIDLRGNTGGRNECADDIVPFIMTQSLDDPFLKKTVSWEGKERTYKLPKPSKLVFNGKIFVLVNGRTYSAGSTIARYLKEYANATILGEETGTRYEGFSAGSKSEVVLNNMDMTIAVPRYHIYFPKSKQQVSSNRGIIPDYYITYTMQDYIDQNDLYIAKVKSLIGS